MDQPPVAEPDTNAPAGGAQAFVPYAQASPFQRAQGLRSARVILDAAYLFFRTGAVAAGGWTTCSCRCTYVAGKPPSCPMGWVPWCTTWRPSTAPSRLMGCLISPRRGGLMRPYSYWPRSRRLSKPHAIRNSLTEKLVRVSYWRRAAPHLVCQRGAGAAAEPVPGSPYSRARGQRGIDRPPIPCWRLVLLT